MPKITSIEIKNDKNGNPMKICTFDGGQKVFVNSKWDEAIYDKVVENAEFELVQDGTFTKVKYDKPVANGAGFGASRGSGIAKAQETKRADIATAQEVRQTGIEISATFRDATLIAIAEINGRENGFTAYDFQERWSYWRQWLLTNFDPNETKRELGF